MYLFMSMYLILFMSCTSMCVTVTVTGVHTQGTTGIPTMCVYYTTTPLPVCVHTRTFTFHV